MVDPEQLLASYRQAAGPSRAVEARMLASLRSELAPLPAQPAATASVSAPGLGVVLKVVTLLAIVVVGASAAKLVRSRAPDDSVEVPSESSRVELAIESAQIEPPRVEPARPSPSKSTSASTLAPAEIDADKRPRERSKASAATRRSAARPRAPASPELAEAPLADEAKLLRAVDSALRRGAPAQARELLDDYQRSFVAGSLADQAMVLELLLACTEQAQAASEVAARYLDAHPQTSARARIEATCSLR